MKIKTALAAFILSLSFSGSAFGECIAINVYHPAGRFCRKQVKKDDCTQKTQPGVCKWKPAPASVTEELCTISDDQKYAICENGFRYVLDKAINDQNRNLFHNRRQLREGRPPIGDGGDGDER